MIVGPEIGRQGEQVGEHELRQGMSILRDLPQRAAQDLGEGGIRRPTFGVAGANQGTATGDLNVGGQLAHEAGLADARLATDEQGLSLARERLTPERMRLAQFPLPANEPAPGDAIDEGQLPLSVGAGIQQVLSLQGLPDFRSGGRSILRPLAHQAHDQAVEQRRDLGVFGAGRDHRGMQMLGDDRQGIPLCKRQSAGCQFIEHHAQGIQVGAAVEILPQRQLGSQVEHGADDQALSSEARGHRAGNAEVHELGGSVPRQQDVLGFEITVHDALLVGVLQSLADLAGDGDDALEVRGPALVQALPFDQLHHDVGCAIYLPRVIDRHDVGVVELGDGLGLVQQALSALGPQVVGRNDLDRDVAVEHRVMRPVHRAHPTLAELGVDAVALVQQGADHECEETPCCSILANASRVRRTQNSAPHSAKIAKARSNVALASSRPS